VPQGEEPHYQPWAFPKECGMRNEVGVERQPVLVRIGMLVRTGGEVDADDVLVADVSVSVPDQSWDVDDAPVLLAQPKHADLAAGRRVGTHIVEDELHLTLQQDVPILMLLVQAPTFDHAGADGETINEYDRVRMPVPPCVEHLEDAAARIRVHGEIARQNPRQQPSGRGALRADGLNIALRRGERGVEEPTVAQGVAIMCGCIHVSFRPLGHVWLPDTTMRRPLQRAGTRLRCHAAI
jgi:hypothetical protein